MSVRELHGWSPAEVTVDAAGEVVSVTVAEPRFNRHDVAVLLASRRAEKEPRGSHGHLLSETTDPAHQYKWKVPLPVTDFAQEKLTRAQDAYKKTYPEADMSALLWRVDLDD